MKKLLILAIAALCILLAGCNNSFAKEEYENTSKIAATDRYAETGSVKESFYNGFHFKAKSFDGRETLLTNTNPEGAFEITATIALSLSEGTAKLVMIDGEGNVSTLAECTAESGAQLVEKRITIPSGECVFKLVGHGCKEVEMQMTLDYEKASVSR